MHVSTEFFTFIILIIGLAYSYPIIFIVRRLIREILSGKDELNEKEEKRKNIFNYSVSTAVLLFNDAVT
ncbi:MAG: hypothetical protein ACTSWY_10775, partial [Promethearchaeota archaeon]